MRQTLATRIWVGFALVIFIFMGSGLSIWYLAEGIQQKVDQIHTLRVPTSFNSKNMLIELNRGYSELQREAIEGNLSKVDTKNIDDRLISYISSLKRLSQNWTNPQNKIRLNNLKESSEKYIATIKSLVENGHPKGKNISFVVQSEVYPHALKMRTILEEMSEDQRGLLAEDVKGIAGSSEDLRDFLVYSILCGILLATLLSFLVTKSIAGPIGKILVFANGVTKGEYSQKLSVGSIVEFLNLSVALSNMQESIKSLTQGLESEKVKLQTEDWVKSKYSGIINQLQGLAKHEKLASIVLSELSVAIESPLSVFYLREDIVSPDDNAESDTLVLVASYAYKKRKGLSSRYKFGEGVVGQCARENKSIEISEIPPNYLSIESGLGSKQPSSIIALPVCHDGEVLGVIEFARFSHNKKEYQQLIEQISVNIGVIIEGISRKLRTEKLLEQSQSMAEELQQQQEELKATNEELEEHTQALRQSEEELKQQSEELQVTNEELEEKTEFLERQKREIEESKESVEQAKREIEIKAKELQVAGKYKSEFLANMSHELRTPLNSLLLLSKFLRDNKTGNLTKDQIEDLDVIYSGGTDLLNLINDILDLSKIESGKMTLDLREVKMSSLFEGLRRQFDPLARNKEFDFIVEELEISAEMSILTDSQRLEQILKNFLSNAFKFTNKGVVKLSVALENESYIFRVEDTGIGIPKEKQDEIFLAFQQADGSTSRKFGGTGLGLTISRELSLLLGGEVSIEKSDSSGSIFRLRLPKRHSMGNSEGSESKINDIQESYSSKKRKIAKVQPELGSPFLPDDRDTLSQEQKSMLIVEDDQEFAKILCKMAKKKGYQILAAGTGAEALALVSSHSPSAILLDIGLPDMDGLELLEELKANTDTRHIPVHIISGQEGSLESLKRGAIGHLLKPVSSDSFMKVFSKIEVILASDIGEVLLIEDDETQVKSVEMMFEGSKINLQVARDGETAIDLLGQFAFDCVILDLGLPGVQGLELLQGLKTNTSLRIPPIIIHTSRELTAQEAEELRLLSDRIVIKGPQSPERLIDEVSLFLHTVESSHSREEKSTYLDHRRPEEGLLGKTVMVVDDDMRNTFALSKVLQDFGLKVILAGNGQVALDKLKEEQEQVDAIIMDIMMPVMDGYEATLEIRKLVKYKDVPIIALTAKAMPEDRKKCIDVGCDDYLTKPVDIDQLVNLLKLFVVDDRSGQAS